MRKRIERMQEERCKEARNLIANSKGTCMWCNWKADDEWRWRKVENVNLGLSMNIHVTHQIHMKCIVNDDEVGGEGGVVSRSSSSQSRRLIHRLKGTEKDIEKESLWEPTKSTKRISIENHRTLTLSLFIAFLNTCTVSLHAPLGEQKAKLKEHEETPNFVHKSVLH